MMSVEHRLDRQNRFFEFLIKMKEDQEDREFPRVTKESGKEVNRMENKQCHSCGNRHLMQTCVSCNNQHHYIYSGYSTTPIATLQNRFDFREENSELKKTIKGLQEQIGYLEIEIGLMKLRDEE